MKRVLSEMKVDLRKCKIREQLGLLNKMLVLFLFLVVVGQACLLEFGAIDIKYLIILLTEATLNGHQRYSHIWQIQLGK